MNIKTNICPDKGSLSFFEGNKDIPFEIKRVYYIYDVPKGTRRGGHAHKNLQQMLFCINGKINIILDDGFEEKNILLDSPNKGILVDKGKWRYMDFIEENSILCVVASEYYDENDYIREYEEFKKLVEDGFWDESKNILNKMELK